MVPPLCAYEPRPHRCEFVRQIGGVDYINDSKATNLDAVEKALLAQSKPVILIAGGKDKGFTFEPLRELVKEKSSIDNLDRRNGRTKSPAIGTARLNPNSRHRWPTRSSARTQPPSPEKWSFFRRAHRPSTCSKVMPTAAISFRALVQASPNEREVQNAKMLRFRGKKTPRHCVRRPLRIGATNG